MIKKAVIAAAGRGTRMLHLTKNTPKQLIKVCSVPFLTYLLNNLLKAGYKELILVVGHKKEKIEGFLKKYKYKLTLINQFEVLGQERYGTACALECVENVVGNENFIMVYGDHLFSVRDFKGFNIDDEYNYMACLKHEHPEKYGVLDIKNGFLKKVIEKPKEYIGNLINIGLYKFTPEIFKEVKKVKVSKRGEYELTDAINFLAEKKKVKVREIHDYWLDFSNPADIIRASKFLKNENSKNNS
jgi:dTDP-glucose pyrophosphorylase